MAEWWEVRWEKPGSKRSWCLIPSLWPDADRIPRDVFCTKEDAKDFMTKYPNKYYKLYHVRRYNCGRKSFERAPTVELREGCRSNATIPLKITTVRVENAR